MTEESKITAANSGNTAKLFFNEAHGLVGMTGVHADLEVLCKIFDSANTVVGHKKLVDLPEKVAARKANRVAEGFGRDDNAVFLGKRQHARKHVEIEVAHLFRVSVGTHKNGGDRVNDADFRTKRGGCHAVDTAVRR